MVDGRTRVFLRQENTGARGSRIFRRQAPGKIETSVYDGDHFGRSGIHGPGKRVGAGRARAVRARRLHACLVFSKTRPADRAPRPSRPGSEETCRSGKTRTPDGREESYAGPRAGRARL